LHLANIGGCLLRLESPGAADRAQQDHRTDPRFAVNAAELVKVIPADLTPDQIDARLGAAWIDPGCVQQFLREFLDDPKLIVEHPGGQVWSIAGMTGTVLASSTRGTIREAG
jgi:N12 class adenine-specific DNA methylase